MEFTLLPYPLPGRIFRSCMPFSRLYDPLGEVYQAYQHNQVQAVVMLISDEESLAQSGRNLRALYQADGLDVIYLPMPDFSTPQSPEPLEEAVQRAREESLAGHALAIHCHAGLGRSGLFAACLALRSMALEADASIAWVRRFVADAVESAAQEKAIYQFAARHSRQSHSGENW